MPIVEPPLGQRMRAFGVVLRGSMTDQRWLAFLHAVAEAIGMSAVAAPAVWTYPVDGKGGNGQTCVLPITESFLVLDTWLDHDGAYLFVCSCKAFIPSEIDAVAEEFGLQVSFGNDRFMTELNLT